MGKTLYKAIKASGCKAELIYQFNFNTVAELDHTAAEYSYGWYNQIYLHSHDGYLASFEKDSD